MEAVRRRRRNASGTERNASGTGPLSAAQHGRVILHAMFFMFSNRLGCLGSLAVSAVLTLVLLAVLGWI